MKVSFNWLQDYCLFTGTPRQLADLLRNLGIGLESIEEVGGDACLDLEITSNRPDLNGLIGIAREVAAATGTALTLPEVKLRGGGPPVEALSRVQVDAPDLCPRYTVRVLTGVRIGPSPDWMQRRLAAVGLRPINNVVDITNYVLFEASQPLHAFDFDRLAEGRVIVRRARANETITAIDGSVCRLGPEMLVIADAARPVALAGIMGGRDTEVSEATATVLLESAQFHSANIRRTSRALGLASDSSYRFERGVDPEGVEWASRRAAALIEELAGGKTAEGLADAWHGRQERRRVQLRVPEVERVLGLAVPGHRIEQILNRLQLRTLELRPDEITVEIPPFRPDLEREIDLIEEVARMEGYDRIPTRPGLGISPVSVPLWERFEAMLHSLLTASGFDEVRTTTFLPESLAVEVSPWSNGPALTIRNPVRKEEGALRRSLIPHLLQVKKTNEDHGHPSARIYEVAPAYLGGPPDAGTREKPLLGFLHDGEFGETKGVLEMLAERLGVTASAGFENADAPFLETGGAAVWKSGGRIWGYLGTASAALVQRYDLRRAPSIAEVDLEALLGAASFDKRLRPLPRFPSTDRDIAIIVPEEVTWARIVEAVQSLHLPLLRSIEFFDLYRGTNIEAGRKSIAFRLVFQSPDRTLTNEEVNGHREAIAARLVEQIGARLR
ncbi:MAG: phenylalanine--tRNA ligase subunit beta [Planctomycetes bacterium]|nr:phenylalanine--tRNA ligase subunit beta [Planctomycetota bacterium]